MKARTQAGNQIHAVIDTAPEQLRCRFVGRPTDDIVAETAMFRRRHAPTTPLEAAHSACARSLGAGSTSTTKWSPSTPSSTSSPQGSLRHFERSTGSAPKSPPPCSPQPVTTPNGCAPQRRSLHCAGCHQSMPPPVANSTTGSTSTGTVTPTGRCTSHRSGADILCGHRRCRAHRQRSTPNAGSGCGRGSRWPGIRCALAPRDSSRIR